MTNLMESVKKLTQIPITVYQFETYTMNRQVRRGGRQGPVRGRRLQNSQRTPTSRPQTITFSDYDSDSDDNIQTVPTARNGQNPSEMFSDSISESDSGVSRPEAKLIAIESDSGYDYYSEKEGSSQSKPNPKPKPAPKVADSGSEGSDEEIVVNTARSPKTAIHCEPTEEPPLKPRPPPTQSPPRIRKVDPAPDTETPAEEAGPAELLHFNIFREQKMFSALRSNELRLMADGQVLLFSQEVKDNIGKLHVITSKRTTGTDPGSGFQGSVRVNNGSERFTVISNEEKPNDDREGELAGIEIAGKTRERGRSMAVVLTADEKPYFAISKSRGLSRVALSALKENKPVQPRFKLFLPKALTCGEDGSIQIEDREVTAMDTFKNCTIQDENGATLFALYKVAEGCYGMKCRAPFTPLIAFGLSIAMMTSNR